MQVLEHSSRFRDMFCAGRVAEEDLKRTMKACGGSIQSTCQNLQGNVLGSCEKFEEIQIGGERWVSSRKRTCSGLHESCSISMLVLKKKS